MRIYRYIFRDIAICTYMFVYMCALKTVTICYIT